MLIFIYNALFKCSFDTHLFVTNIYIYNYKIMPDFRFSAIKSVSLAVVSASKKRRGDTKQRKYAFLNEHDEIIARIDRRLHE